MVHAKKKIDPGNEDSGLKESKIVVNQEIVRLFSHFFCLKPATHTR